MEGASAHWFCERGILLKKLDNAVGQLGMVAAQRLHLVERDEHTQQEHPVLLLQREGKPIDDAARVCVCARV